MRYPDIYVVGAPKCGTTSLQYYLGQHPEIFAPEFKEPHYHTVAKKGLPTWGVQTQQQYFDIYRDARPNQMLLDASAWNLYIAEAAEFIKETSPDAYILISLRHPVDRAYSHFMHMVQRGWEKYYRFQEAIRYEPQRVAEGAFWDFHYLSVGFYASQVQRYLNLFSQEKIKIIFFEEWTRNIDTTMQDIYKFLGVNSASWQSTSVRKNVTELSYDQILRMRLQRVKPLKNALGLILPDTAKQKVMRLLKTRSGRTLPQINPEVHTLLCQTYKNDIERLETLLGYRVAVWHS